MRDPAWAEALRAHRWQGGAIAGPFEAWLLHRSLPTLELRLARQSDNALALARFLRERPEVSGVRHPFLEDHPDHEVARRQMRHGGALVGFALDGAERAQRFLGALELVSEATSFGGVHASAERRGRWGTDAVPEGFIRFSAGCEDAEDLLADVAQALEQKLRGPPGGGPLECVMRRAPGVRGSAARAEGATSMSRRRPRGLEGPFERREQHHRATNLGGTLASPWASGSVRPRWKVRGQAGSSGSAGRSRCALPIASRPCACRAARGGSCSPTSRSIATARARAAS